MDAPPDAMPPVESCAPVFEKCDAAGTTCLVSPMPELASGPAAPAVSGLYAVKGSDEVWGFADGNYAHYSDMCGWHRTSIPATAGSYPVSETGPSNVWFSGGARWDGMQFVTFPFPANQVVWTAGPDVGWYGCNRWDGTTWTSYSCTPTALGGSSASDVWLGGDLGKLWHWDGTTFTGPIDSPLSNASPTPPPVNTILAFAPDDAFFRTSYGWYHWDGTQFIQITSGTPAFPSTARFWFQEQYWNGSTFLFPQPNYGGYGTPTYNSLDSGGWVMASNSTVSTNLWRGTGSGATASWKPWSATGPNVWAYDHAHLFSIRPNPQAEDDIPISYFDGTGWHEDAMVFPHPAPSPPAGYSSVSTFKLYPTGPDELWALAYQLDGAGCFVSYLLRYKAGATTVMQQGQACSVPYGTSPQIYFLQSSGPDDVWISLYPDLWHWNGSMLTDEMPGAGLLPLWMPGPGKVWAVGSTVYMYDGATWTTMPGPPNSNYSPTWTWGSSTHDVWSWPAHWDGSQWTFPQSPPIDMSSVTNVVSTGPTDAYFIGVGQLWHYDGSTFTSIPGSNASTFAGFDPGTHDMWFQYSAETRRVHLPSP